MGHKLLKFSFLLFCLLTFSYANSDLNKIDSIIEKIKIKRVGLQKKQIYSLKDPFFYDKKTVLKIKHKKYKKNAYRTYYRLQAIINNRAKINRKWYKIGNKIGGYKLYEICSNCVKLKKRGKTLTLYLYKTKNRHIKISVRK